MKLRCLLLLGILLLISSCGGSKKIKQTQRNIPKTGQDKIAKYEDLAEPKPADRTPLPEHIPDIEALPNPLEHNYEDYQTLTERYIAMYKPVAIEEMAAYGIPASITIAQGILESGSGKSELTQRSNNHFGIKCHEWTGPYVLHDDDLKQECFRKYENPNYSFRDHSLFLANRARYKNLFSLSLDDYKGWARGLKSAGYATDPAYPRKLIGLIERHELYALDKEALQKYPELLAKLRKNREKNPVYEETDNPFYVVQRGDTLYSISRRFGISVAQLKKQNKISDDRISVGQQLRIK